MHPEIAQCLRLVARLAYILGDHQEALNQQHKALLMSERCCGLDHPQTILEYVCPYEQFMIIFRSLDL